jgi:hypothetical protein
MNREINVNDVWKRKTPVGDDFDEIVVCGLVDHASRLPNEYTVRSATAFGSPVQTDAAGILDHCELVTSGDPESEWS